MANTDRPHGFQVFRMLRRAGLYAVATAPTIAFSCGDMVQGENSGIACTKGNGTMLQVYDTAVISTTEGDTRPIYGAVISCFDENMSPILYIAAARVGDGTIAGYLLVADHPDQEFEAQADGSIAAADIDLNHEITVVALNAPNTYTGISTMEIAAAGAAVTATIPLKMGRQAYPEQDVITAAGCRWIVQINPSCHYWADGTAL
jgi:hypothetical protein